MAARIRGGGATQAPQFDFDPSALHDPTPGDPSAFGDEPFEGLSFAAIERDTWDVGVGSTIEACRFDGLDVGSWALRGARVVESAFTAASIPVVSAARGGWRDLDWRDSRFGSVEADDAAWRGIRFTRCKLGYVNLRAAELLDVAFVDCTIDEMDLLDASARRVAFPSTRIGTLNVTGASLTDVDLRGAELGQAVGLAGLRGATISPEQLQLMAAALADLAGLIVED